MTLERQRHSAGEHLDATSEQRFTVRFRRVEQRAASQRGSDRPRAAGQFGKRLEVKQCGVRLFGSAGLYESLDEHCVVRHYVWLAYRDLDRDGVCSRELLD